MILTFNEISSITSGKWKNVKNELSFNSINFTENNLQKGDLFVVRSSEQVNDSSNENRIDIIIKQQPIALILDNPENIPNIPCLIVKNTKNAFREIAIASRKKAKAKRILVTGSYGKTGFKVRLEQLIKDELRTKIISNSANEDYGVFKALSSLSKEDEITIIEVAGSNLDRALRRSALVKPHICNITSIGHEDIYQHKSIDNTIFNKASVVTHLEDKGICIIQKDKYYQKMFNSILKHNPNTIIKTVGSKNDCDAYIIEKKFINFAWDIKASIEGIIINYRVPFIDYHSPISSLFEFLNAKYLGIDIQKISKKYVDIKNAQSSGRLYNVEIKQKSFILCDQSSRGGIENYESFFKTVSYVKAKRGGRKILLTSAFVDIEDNEMDNIKPNAFKKIINEAKFDAIFTVENFCEHIEVLDDKQIWKKHSKDYRKIRDDVLSYIGSDDILFVKGIYESNLKGFLPYIKRFTNSNVNIYTQEKEYKEIGKRLEPCDIELYRRKLEKTSNTSWCYYFPFLIFFAKSNNKELLIKEIDGSLVIYFLRNANKENPILELFFPPFPMNESVLKKAQEIIYEFRKEKKSNILWVDERDKKIVSKYFKLIEKEEEYIFNFNHIKKLEGSMFKNLRYNLKTFNKNTNVELRNYTINDYFECLELLKKWNNKQKDKNKSISDLEYTKNCLRFSSEFDKSDLFGKVVLIDGSIKAFAFAGKIYENVANVFIVKADLDIKGLAYFIKYQLLKELKNFTYINDSSDLGYKGLKNSKNSFVPISMHKVYKARDGF